MSDEIKACFRDGRWQPDMLANLAENLTRSRDFYKRRVQLLERNQHRFREPERTILVDALANAQFLPDPDGSRYGKTGLDTEDGPDMVRSPMLDFECKLCGWQGFHLTVDEAPEFHSRWNSKNGNKPCPGQIQTT